MNIISVFKNLFTKQVVEESHAERSNLSKLEVQQAGNSSPKSKNIVTVLAKKIGLSLSGDGRDFAEPEFDLSVIDAAYDTEAYVRQGIDKYIDKMFKAGWGFTGKNTSAVDYIKQRFNYMAEVTQIPTDKLFIEYSEDVVKFSNAIIAKARMSDQSQIPQGSAITGLNGAQPVVGYFPLNVTTMKVKRDKFGTIKQWEQEVEGQDKPVKFKSEDVIHTYYKRKKGNAFGTPFLLSVLDDIRALRQAEDNVLRMLYRHIYPFYHVKIGNQEAPGTDPEITQAKNDVDGMEVDGGLVTSERWEISAVSADKVIDANPYLKYFEDRVFSGLGVPATMFGRGATANKSTSDNMDSEFIDRIKAFQKVIEADVNQFMIKELLLEGGFDPINNPDDMVYFKFNEIDIDMQIKLENQAIYKYEHMAVTEDEMRQDLGLDPITDRSKMYTNLVDKEKASIKTNNSDDEEKGNAETNNKVKPKNQHTKKDNYMHRCVEHLEELNEQIVKDILNTEPKKEIDKSYIALHIKLKSSILEEINNSFSINNSITNKICNDLLNKINEIIDEKISNREKAIKVNSVFDCLLMSLKK